MKKNENSKEKSKTSKFKIIFLTIILIIIIVALTIGILFLLKKFNKSKSNDMATANDSVKNENTNDIGYYGEFDPENVTILDEENNIKAISDELIVTFTDDADKKDVQKILDKYDCEIVGEIYILNQYQVKFDNAEDISEIKEELNKNENVDNVMYNYINVLETDSDSEIHLDKDYHIAEIGADKAYEQIKGKKKINVGVMDNPVQYSHEDLGFDKNHMQVLKTDDFETIDDILDYFATYNHNEDNDHNIFNKGECKYTGFYEHGTHVAGIIAAKHNKKGMDGINDNVNMYYAAPWYFTKSDDADGHFTSDATSFSYTYALAYLIMSDCKVINMSLSKNAVDSNGEKIYAENSSEYQEYLKYFESFFNKIRKTGKDFLIVKSAANNNVDSRNDIIGTVLKNIDFSKERTIIVGAARRPRTLQFEKAIKDGGIFNFVWRKEYYSNYGELVDIFAPGDVYSSIYCNKYKWITGTSQATPIVSGVASMVWEINPNLTAKQVKEIILTSTDKSLSYDGKTYGIVNAELSVENAKDTFGSSRVDIKRDYGVIMGKLESPQDIEIDEALIIFTDLENDAKKYISEIEFYDYELVLPFGKYKINLYINGDEYNIKENSEIEISSNSVIPYDITICDNDENVNNSDNEHTYKVYMESVTWEEAKARCEEMGGHLATITSEEEQKYIESINTARVWIGGYKDDDNNWKWVTGEEWNYTNWGDGEPNNSSNVVANERYVAVWSSKWNDLANTNKSEQKGFICEWEAKQ